jgi:hypothetical protein
MFWFLFILNCVVLMSSSATCAMGVVPSNSSVQEKIETSYSGVIPENPDYEKFLGFKIFEKRTYNRIVGDKDDIKFLSAEPSLERLESMLDEAIVVIKSKVAQEEAAAKKPIKIHLHILSVLDNSKGSPEQSRIKNVGAIRDFFLATYKNKPKYKNINLQITQKIASMRDHQIRDLKGDLLDFAVMDSWLIAHRGHPNSQPGVHQVYNIHCRGGVGRSATAMTCEYIRYNGLLPTDPATI